MYRRMMKLKAKFSKKKNPFRFVLVSSMNSGGNHREGKLNDNESEGTISFEDASFLKIHFLSVKRTGGISIIPLAKRDPDDLEEFLSCDSVDYPYLLAEVWYPKEYQGHSYAWSDRNGFCHNWLYYSNFNTRLLCLNGDGLDMRSSNWARAGRKRLSRPEKSVIAPKRHVNERRHSSHMTPARHSVIGTRRKDDEKVAFAIEAERVYHRVTGEREIINLDNY